MSEHGSTGRQRSGPGRFSSPDGIWFGIAVCGSFLLTLLGSWLDDVINLDGVYYVKSAHLFLEQGFDAAIREFRWPLYSILIALTSSLFGLPLESAAHLLDAALMGILAGAFLLLYREVFCSSGGTWAPCLVFLLFADLNEYRDYVVRDFGYWAFGTLSVVGLYRFRNTLSWRDGLYWQACVAVAFLFRLEALGIIIVAWLVVLTDAQVARQRLSGFLRSNWLLVGTALVGLGWLLFSGISGGDLRLERLRHIIEFVNPLDFMQGWVGNAQQFAAAYLPVVDGVPVLPLFAVGSMAVVLFSVINKMNVLGVIGLVVGAMRPSAWSAGRLRILLWVVALQLLVITLFYQKNLFLQGRYLIFTALLLLVPVAAVFQQVIPDWLRARRVAPLAFLAVAVLYSALDGFSLNRSKSYLAEWGRALPAVLPQRGRAVTNNLHLHHYSGYRVDYSVTWQGGEEVPEFPLDARFVVLLLPEGETADPVRFRGQGLQVFDQRTAENGRHLLVLARI